MGGGRVLKRTSVRRARRKLRNPSPKIARGPGQRAAATAAFGAARMETLCARSGSTFGRCMPGKPIEEHLAAERRAVVGRMVAAVLRAVQVPPPGSLARKAAPARPAALSQSASVRSVAPPTADMAWGSSRDPQPLGPPLEDDAVSSYQRAKAAEALAQACARGRARQREAGLDDRGLQPRLGGRPFDISAEFLWTSGGGCTIVERLRGVPVPLESALAAFHEIDLIEMEKMQFPLLPKIERFRVPHRFAANDFLMRNCVQPWGPFPGADSVHNLQLFALPQRGEVMLDQSPPEARPSSRRRAPAARAAAQAQHHSRRHDGPPSHSGLRGHPSRRGLLHEGQAADPLWVIPGPLVRWAGATFVRKAIGPVEALVASMGAEEPVPRARRRRRRRLLRRRARAAPPALSCGGAARTRARAAHVGSARDGRAADVDLSILKPPSQEEAPWTVAIAPPAGFRAGRRVARLLIRFTVRESVRARPYGFTSSTLFLSSSSTLSVFTHSTRPRHPS